MAEKSSKLESPIARLCKQEKYPQYDVCSVCRLLKPTNRRLHAATACCSKSWCSRNRAFGYVQSLHHSFILRLMILSRNHVCFLRITNDDSSCLALARNFHIPPEATSNVQQMPVVKKHKFRMDQDVYEPTEAIRAKITKPTDGCRQAKQKKNKQKTIEQLSLKTRNNHE